MYNKKCLCYKTRLILILKSKQQNKNDRYKTINLCKIVAILFYYCINTPLKWFACVVYWPLTRPNMPFQRRRKCIILSEVGRAWLTIWDRVKISCYSHKLMHQKVSDLWTAWQLFLLNGDQTCHSKDGGSAYSNGQLWGDIEWALNYYITECTGNSMSWRQDAVEKASTKQREPSGPRLMSLEIREMEKWCCREKSTQQRAGPPGLRLSNPRERERNADGHKSGGSICCSSVRSPTPLSHTTLWNKVRGIFF